MTLGAWLLACSACIGSAAGQASRDIAQAEHEPGAAASLARAARAAPLFVANCGQWPEAVRFLGRAKGMVVRAEPAAIAIELREGRGSENFGVLVRLAFEDVSPGARVEGEAEREATWNFFLGNDRSRWVSNAPSFDALRYRGLYPGIDLELHARNGELEYDLHLASGVDASAVHVEVEGAQSLSIEPDGSLIAHTELGDLRQLLPRCHQVDAQGREHPIACAYRLRGENGFELELGPRDAALATLVDPELVWSTFIGSAVGDYVGDHATGVAVDASGDVYVTAWETGVDFPVTPGVFSSGNPLGNNIAVARLRASDGALLYSTIVGGTMQSVGTGPPNQRPSEIRVDAQGRATVAGTTVATDFPTTQSAFQTQAHTNFSEGFVFRLSPAGDQMIYSTLLGGSSQEQINALALAPSGAAIVGGYPTEGPPGPADFPTTPGSYQPSYHPTTAAFLTRIDPTGSFLEWSTLLDASNVTEIVLDSDESVVFTSVVGPGSGLQGTPGAWAPPWPMFPGNLVCVARLEATGNAMRWVSVFGGSNSTDAEALGLDASGGPVIAGRTMAVDFPLTPGCYQSQAPPVTFFAFVTRLDADGSFPIYSTFLGGGHVLDLAVDPSGVVTVGGGNGGYTSVPTTPGAYQTVAAGGPEVFVTRLAPHGERLFYSTFIGGSNTEEAYALAMTPERRVSVAGYSTSPYPTTPGSAFPNYQGGQTDAIVTTLDLVLEGVTKTGVSVPACMGPIELNATSMPRAGNGRFGLYVSGAAPMTSGWLLFGSPTSTPYSFRGVQLSLDHAQPIVRVPVHSDRHGYVELDLPLTGASSGTVFAVQCLLHTTVSCAGQGPWSTSNAVEITVQ